MTFDVQSSAAEVRVTYAYDDNGELLTETLDAPGAADDRQSSTGYAQTIEEHSREGATPTRQVTPTVDAVVGLSFTHANVFLTSTAIKDNVAKVGSDWLVAAVVESRNGDRSRPPSPRRMIFSDGSVLAFANEDPMDSAHRAAHASMSGGNAVIGDEVVEKSGQRYVRLCYHEIRQSTWCVPVRHSGQWCRRTT